MILKFKLIESYEQDDWYIDLQNKRKLLQPYVKKAIDIIERCGYTGYNLNNVKFMPIDTDMNYIAKFIPNDIIEISYSIIDPEVQYLDSYNKDRYEKELISVLIHEFAHYMDFQDNKDKQINSNNFSLSDMEEVEEHTENWNDIIRDINAKTNNAFNIKQEYYLKSFDDFKCLQQLLDIEDRSNFPEDFPCKIKCNNCGYYKNIVRYKDYINNKDLLDNLKSVSCPLCNQIGTLQKIINI